MLILSSVKRLTAISASLLILTCQAAQAQTPSVNPILLRSSGISAHPAEAKQREKSDADVLAQIATQQAETSKQLESATIELAKANKALAALPSNADEDQRRLTTQTWTYQQARVDLLSQSNDLLKTLERQIGLTTSAEQDKDSWAPPKGNPPWPLATGDEVMQTMLQLQTQIAKHERKIAIFDQDIAAQKKRRSQAEIELRQLTEKSASAISGQGGDSKIDQDINLAKQRLSLYDLELSRTDIERQVIFYQDRMSLVQLANVKKTWDYYKDRFTFSQAELETTLSDINKNIVSLRQKEQQTSARIDHSVVQARNAKARLDQLAERPNASTRELDQARRAWMTLEGAAGAIRTERTKYRAFIDIELIKKDIWTLRQQLREKEGIADKLPALQKVQAESSRKLEQGQQYLNEVIEERTQALTSVRDQRQNAAANDQAFYDGLIQPIASQIEDLRAIEIHINLLKQLLTLSAGELDRSVNRLSLWENTKKLGVTVLGAVRAVWDYELMAVDDTAIVDGREIKTKRSVTVGKSVGALAILFIGFSLISKIIRRSLALAVSKAGLTASRSVVMGRWLTLGGGITLVICAFNLVEIPLSAFAFFGGALAIGVGFGTQNLLKNLFSGVMLLIEKPIRIGDVIEVDNVTGTVTSIGIRFSTIQSAHGTDNLIPNSVLVEQKLVNWTYSTRDIRREILITVAYGSDAHQVATVLEQTCLAQDGVLAQPAPLVALQDLSDRGLVFCVQLWVRLEPTRSVAAILGKVRMAILDAFATEGIELPFPQYVVQLEQKAN